MDGKALEHGSVENSFITTWIQCQEANHFKARVDVILVEESLAVVLVCLREGWGGRIDFTDVLLHAEK